MVRFEKQELLIRIPSAEPEESRELMIRDMAAVQRWYANAMGMGALYERDWESLERLAHILESLVDEGKI